MSDAIAQQCTVCESLYSAHPSSSSGLNNPFLKVDNDSTVWISGVKYQPAPEPMKASVAKVTVGSKTIAMFEGFGLSAMQRLI